MQPRLFDEETAAAYLGVSRRLIRKLWAERRLTAVKVGRLVQFDERDLDTYIDRQRVEAVR
jgi:excisionase family DNA binding protein